MKNYKIPLLVTSFFLTLVQANAACNSSCKRKAEQALAKMSLTEKIGQMLLVGFRGTKVNSNDPIVSEIQKAKVGSVILFERDFKLSKKALRNIESPRQLKALTSKLQSLSKVPLFISIDEEGGKVNRLKKSRGFSQFPSAAALGKKDDLDYTYKVASQLAAQLQSNGINMNFAPVVDVNINTRNPVIGKLQRSYSTNEQKVAEHAEQAIKAHLKRNITPALKHFPGHGSSSNDSHLAMVDITSSWQPQRELYPYEYLINENLVDMIMTAHVFNTDLDPKYPATLSRKIMTGLLRNKLGYEGVIISDDMNMAAIDKYFQLNESIRLAIVAGVDILLFGNNIVYDKAIGSKVQRIIQNLIKNKKISAARIDISARRVLRLKFSRL